MRLFLFSSILTVIPAVAQVSPPDVIYSESYDGAAWVSASLIDLGDDIDLSYFSTRQLQRLDEHFIRYYEKKEEMRKRGVSHNDSCVQFERDFGHAPIRKGRTYFSLDQLIMNSMAILYVEVTDVTPGFMSGNPATLVTFSVRETIKPDPSFEKSVLFWDCPLARFSVGGLSFCCDSKGYSVFPETGMRAIIFPLSKPWDEEGQIITLKSQSVFLIKDNGSVVWPKKLPKISDDLNNIDALLTRITSSLPETRSRQ